MRRVRRDRGGGPGRHVVAQHRVPRRRRHTRRVLHRGLRQPCQQFVHERSRPAHRGGDRVHGRRGPPARHPVRLAVRGAGVRHRDQRDVSAVPDRPRTAVDADGTHIDHTRRHLTARHGSLSRRPGPLPYHW
ncbi:hypothetical protein RHCRD62_20740 [Rhodococcus sp. RD6.2]|nr:hypothetical protein RHCRD62_20740 [Rhodococcus sp. RD6.2]